MTATSGSVTKTATATVSQVAAAVALAPTSLSFTSLGDTATVLPTVTDTLGATMPSPTVTWATSDHAVATVSSTGLVTSVTDGTATITATAGSASATASVTVEEAFYLAANGVTVTCSAAGVGDTGEVGGVTYTKRSKAQIDALVDAEDYAPLATTCTSSVTDMSWMFYRAPAFNQNIGSWDVSSATNMRAMFATADDFNQDISSWNVSSVTDMYRMFYSADDFDQDIGSWDVSSVTDMKSMFRRALAFNQDLSGWCVSLITTEPVSFDSGATSWVLDRPVWGTCLT